MVEFRQQHGTTTASEINAWVRNLLCVVYVALLEKEEEEPLAVVEVKVETQEMRAAQLEKDEANDAAVNAEMMGMGGGYWDAEGHEEKGGGEENLKRAEKEDAKEQEEEEKAEREKKVEGEEKEGGEHNAKEGEAKQKEEIALVAGDEVKDVERAEGEDGAASLGETRRPWPKS